MQKKKDKLRMLNVTDFYNYCNGCMESTEYMVRVYLNDTRGNGMKYLDGTNLVGISGASNISVEKIGKNVFATWCENNTTFFMDPGII